MNWLAYGMRIEIPMAVSPWQGLVMSVWARAQPRISLDRGYSLLPLCGELLWFLGPASRSHR